MTDGGREGAGKDPFHGVTLEQIVRYLEARLGWEGLAAEVRVNCFRSDPSVKSSLKFLRKTPWARSKVEELYVRLKRSDKPGGRDPWSQHRGSDQ